MRTMTQEEHGELLVYLEELIRIAVKEKGYYGYERYMGNEALKTVNDTFVELLNADIKL